MDTIEVRQQQLDNLNQFIESSKVQIKFLLDSFNWSQEKTSSESLVTCPLNRNHLMPAKSLAEHTQKCSFKKQGYTSNDTFLSEPSSENSNFTVRIDKSTKKEIFSSAQAAVTNFQRGWNGTDPDPKTQDRLQTTFSSDERLALYDYCVKETKGPAELPEFNVLNFAEENRELTYEEQLEEERNAKRRRIKYKTVHTSNKNYTEVIREVIDNQMNAYEEYLAEKNPGFKKTESNSRHEDDDRQSYRENDRSSRKNRREYDYDDEKSEYLRSNYKRRSQDDERSSRSGRRDGYKSRRRSQDRRDHSRHSRTRNTSPKYDRRNDSCKYRKR